MPVPTDGQILHCISDQVQLDTCLEPDDANHYAGGLLTGYRLGKNDLTATLSLIEARGLARLAIEADRAESSAA